MPQNARDHPWAVNAQRRKEINKSRILDFVPTLRWFRASRATENNAADLATRPTLKHGQLFYGDVGAVRPDLRGRGLSSIGVLIYGLVGFLDYAFMWPCFGASLQP